MKAHFILYVSNQKTATEFYEAALDLKPTLNVPGMTEFTLNDGCILGLMPERGIKRLLGEKLPDPERATGIPRAELYLRVDQPETYHHRAIQYGARELSAVDKRDWGDIAGYSLDPDGHVIAFASLALKANIGNKIYNIRIAVKNLNESMEFYRRVFAPLGFGKGRLYDDPYDLRPTFVIGNGETHLELMEYPQLVVILDDQSIVGEKIEFRASDKEEVDVFHEHLLKNDVRVVAKPQFFYQDVLTDEGDFWYATCFLDNSGNKFTLVCTPV